MYAILRFQKKTGGKLLNTQKHNERQKERYKSNPDIDRERSDENRLFVNSWGRKNLMKL